ncbi:MAG: ABC transporter permease [Clostridia bacterium]
MKQLKTADCSPAHIKYLSALKKKRAFVIISRIVILVLFIAIWEISAHFEFIDPFITSSPSRILKTICNLYNDGSLFLHIGVTLFETVVGFLLGTALGIGIAILLWWSPTLSRILDPYLIVLNALPKIALGPILIVWIGAGITSIIVMALMISVVVTIITMLTGFLNESADKSLLMRTLGATKFQTLRLIVLPSSVPTMISSLKISVSMSFVGVIVGEYLVSQAGLGYLIVYGGQVFKLDLVMASVVILCVLAALMYYMVAFVEKRMQSK